SAMARGHSDATLRVERDDRGTVECAPHMASSATFSYLLPLYGQRASRSSGISPATTMTYSDFLLPKIQPTTVFIFRQL
ncbi:MAG TPA: hypothetical protein VFR57_09125, partial [Burkholderiales bacterium]|nr:hypothetical protein [Burkholderiales bacterium]